MKNDLVDINEELLAAGEEPVSTKEEALVRRALLEKGAVPDARKEFLRFKRKHQTGPSHMRFAWLRIAGGLAAAACLVMLFLLFSKEERKLQDGEEIIYTAKEIGKPEISLECDNKTLAYEVKATSHPVIKEINYSTTDLDDYEKSTTTLTVPPDKVVKIELPDGSMVWLNAMSRLVYPVQFSQRRPREVKLEGEAYFAVAKDAVRPFIVDAGGVRTRVLGTEFNLRAYDGELAQVTLVSGSVACSVQSPRSQEVKLFPGQQLSIVNYQLSVNEVDPTVFTAWREGRFYFDNQTCREVMTEIGRWYNMNVIFKESKYLDERLHFNADRRWSVSRVLEEMKYISDCQVRIEDNNLIVY